MVKKFLDFLRKIHLHWFVAFLAYGFVCYVRLFGVWGPAVALALLLLLRRQIGKWDLHIPPAPAPKV